VLPLEQPRVAGREPRSEQRSEGQPGYSGESLVHLHLHRAPISATRLTAIQATDILLTGIQVTRSRAMDIRVTRDSLLTPASTGLCIPRLHRTVRVTPPRVTDRQAIRDFPPIPDPRPLRRPSDSGRPAYPGGSGYGYQSPPPYSPYSGSGYGNPVAGYPGDRPLEDGSPGAEYAIEPAS